MSELGLHSSSEPKKDKSYFLLLDGVSMGVFNGIGLSAVQSGFTYNFH